MKKKNGFKLSCLPCAVNTLECNASLSLLIVIEFFYQTLGVLSQDGLLRFIDIHACKQLFEIGGADEVLYPNDKVLICSPFYLFLIILFFFFWLGLLFLYSPNAGPLPFQTYFYERELLSFIHFTHHKLCHVSYLIALFPSKLRRFYTYMQTLMHVDYPPPPNPPSQNVFDFIFYWGDSSIQKKLETIWVNKVHIAGAPNEYRHIFIP